MRILELSLSSCVAATPGVFDHVVVNDNVDEAFRELEGIINKVLYVGWMMSCTYLCR